MFVKANLVTTNEEVYINSDSIIMMKRLLGGRETVIMFSAGKNVVVKQNLIDFLVNPFDNLQQDREE